MSAIRFSAGFTNPRGVFGAPSRMHRTMEDFAPAQLDEIASLPLETLRNLWLAKYGGHVVNVEEVVPDAFFRGAAYILCKGRQMEWLEEADLYGDARVAKLRLKEEEKCKL